MTELAATEHETTALADLGFAQACFRVGGLPARYRYASLVTFERLGGSSEVVQRLIAWLNAPVRRWLFLHGPSGVGKSSLAAAVACLLIGQGREPHFWGVMRLMDRVRDQISQGKSQAEFFDELGATDVLVLDDLGRELGTDWAIERLRLLIGERYEHERLTIVTSNLSVTDISKHIDEPLAWRIGELADVVHIPGPNLRAAQIKGRA